MSIKLSVCVWYDTVSVESAIDGDYASTGNEFRSFECDTIEEALDVFMKHYTKQYWETPSFNRFINEVFHATDGDVDVRNGDVHYDRLILSVETGEDDLFSPGDILDMYSSLLENRINELYYTNV